MRVRRGSHRRRPLPAERGRDSDPTAWYGHAGALFLGGNEVRLLPGGDALFPAMIDAIRKARHEVWVATYIFHDDPTAKRVADALDEAAHRGVRVRVVVDGFGSRAELPALRRWWSDGQVALAVFRPIDRWYAFLQPGQFRRMHQKLCVVDGEVGFVGGINIIDDRIDLRHGMDDAPRLDFAVEVRGPLVQPIEQTARAMWTRAAFGHDWREEVKALARSARPVQRARGLLHRLRIMPPPRELLPGMLEPSPVRAALVVRDNLRQRSAIEIAYIEAFRRARRRIDLVCPYFYPGRIFRRTLRQACKRGVKVRLLLQGKLDYRIAGLAASVLYDELLSHGVRIFEYTPAFLHAKIAIVDDDWATVGSSNIDPLSLLLNLEANVIVNDAQFTRELMGHFEQSLAVSREVTAAPVPRGWWAAVRRAMVAWGAMVYLRMAGITRPY
jgi:cardiolipin synthase